MKVLVTGACGFVGSRLARRVVESLEGVSVYGMDNFCRPGSERNRAALRALGVRVLHGDTRCASDFEQFPAVDWVIDAAANASVLAGTAGRSSSRQLVEFNLGGTVETLEYCKAAHAGLVLLSSSRVYSIEALLAIPLAEEGGAFRLAADSPALPGVGAAGIDESFSTAAPVSLYGATKLASEALAFEYGSAFDFPVWVDRCGVMAGAGQFGTAEQGIFSYWLHAHRAGRRLRYCGFGCRGLQVRDALHPDDLAEVALEQMRRPDASRRRLFHIAGGAANATSLARLTAWCDARFGARAIEQDFSPRPFDVPWVVMDCRLAEETFGWKPRRSLPDILEEIAQHAAANPDWLDLVGA